MTIYITIYIYIYIYILYVYIPYHFIIIDIYMYVYSARTCVYVLLFFKSWGGGGAHHSFVYPKRGLTLDGIP